MAIYDGAFSADALKGGFIGVLIVGLQRAAFSNEAGVGSAAIPQFRLRAFIWRAVALLRARGGAGIARRHRDDIGTRHGDFNGTDVDDPRGHAGGRGVPRA